MTDTVKIGAQEWMSKDLIINTYNNGEKITVAHTRGDWYHNNLNKIPCLAYSKFFKGVVFYNYYCLLDSRGILNGFKIPSVDDINELIEYLGGSEIAGLKLKSTDNELFEEVAYLEPEEKELKKQFGNSSAFSAVETGFKLRNGHESSLSYSMWLLDKNNKPSIFILVEGDNQAFIEENKTDLIINCGFVVRGIRK
jgi:uncharacterized protein (TIGR02145 family)